MTEKAQYFLYVFGAVAAIIVLARLAGKLFTKMGQPAVVGEVAVGLLLGPSVLGQVMVQQGHRTVGLDEVLFPLDIRPILQILAQLGLVFYMFVVGLELDPEAVRHERKAALRISLSSIALAFALGAAVGAVAVTPEGDTSQLTTALFCGLAISGSAFAILARILEERRLFRTRIGSVLMGCAVVDDVAVWILVGVVSFVGATSGGDSSATSAVLHLAGFGVFAGLLFLVVRRLLFHEAMHWDRSPSTAGELSADRLALLLAVLFMSAVATDYLLGSPILGAFMFGAAVPRVYAAAMIRQVGAAIAPIASVVLLPIFFALTGLRVDVAGLNWGLLAAFLVAATAGKMLGAAGAAYVSGFKGRRALAIGTLMNTRGLTELAILSIGLTSGLISTEVFAVLVCTAIGSTILSGPMLALVYPERLIDKDIASVERDLQATTGTYRIMVVLQDRELPTDETLLDLARWLSACEDEAEIVLAMIGAGRAAEEAPAEVMRDISRLSSELDRLRVIGDALDGPGRRVVPQALLSDDPVRELVALVERLEPTIVVVARGDGAGRAAVAIDALLEQRIADIVRVDRPASIERADLVLANGPGSDAEASAAEVAVRVAWALGRPVRLPSTRRLDPFREAAEAGGVPVEGDGAAVVVRPESTDTVAVAFGRPEAHRERMAQALAQHLQVRQPG